MGYKFLIYFTYRYAVPTGTPLENEIVKRGDTVKWFTPISNEKKYIPNPSNVIDTIQEVVEYNPDIILSITDYVPDFLRGLKVQIFHGFNPDKRDDDEHFTIRGFYDLYCTQGPATTDTFRKLQEKYRHFEVEETGWPKMDALFEDEKEHIPKSPLPVVMITSTFSRRLSLALNDAVYEEMKRLSQTGKYNFICTLHPILPEEVVNKWKHLEGEHFTFYDTTNLVPLFKRADMMFSDTTSAIQEFALLQKPIVTFRHHRPGNYVMNITETDQIEPALDRALSRPANLMEALQYAARSLHPYTDGKSAKRVIDVTINFLHKDKSYLKRKPLNLVRKYKVRKSLGYFTLKSYNKPFTR